MYISNHKLSARGLARLFLLILVTNLAKAQQIKFNQGIALTHFSYQNDQGQAIQGLKQGSGLAIQLSIHKTSVVDSAKYKLEQSPMAIYLGQNPKMAKFLSLINYDLGVQLTQLNAAGDIQNIAFNYQTDYIGLLGKFGIRIPLPFRCALNLQGIASINKIIHGNQLLMNHYIDLTEDPQFSQIKLIRGYGVEFEKQISGRAAGFIAYQQTQTVNSNPIGQSTLHLQPSIFSLGIRFLN